MLELTAAPFRYHELLYEQWNNLRGSRPFPSIDEFDAKLLGKVWGSCFVVNYVGNEENAVQFLHKGEYILKAEKEDAEIAGYFFSTDERAFQALIKQVVESGKPLVDQSELIDSQKRIVRYRRCLLPFDEGQGTVTHVVGCVRWKAFGAQDGLAQHDFGWEGPSVR